MLSQEIIHSLATCHWAWVESNDVYFVSHTPHWEWTHSRFDRQFQPAALSPTVAAKQLNVVLEQQLQHRVYGMSWHSGVALHL